MGSRGELRIRWRCCKFSCWVFWPLYKLLLRHSILALSLELLADKKLSPTSSHGRSLSSTSTSGLTIITLAGPPLLTAPTLCVQLTASQAGKRVGSRWSPVPTTSTRSFPRTRSRRGRWSTCGSTRDTTRASLPTTSLFLNWRNHLHQLRLGIHQSQLSGSNAKQVAVRGDAHRVETRLPRRLLRSQWS